MEDCRATFLPRRTRQQSEGSNARQGLVFILVLLIWYAILKLLIAVGSVGEYL